MDFGSLTLSDHYDPHNPRTASAFVLEIRDQAMLAERLDLHSAWIGEHHVDRFARDTGHNRHLTYPLHAPDGNPESVADAHGGRM